MTPAPVNIRTTLSRRIWRVTLDDVFYGDYRSERHAAESAEAAARALRAEGRTANVHAPVEALKMAS